MHLLELWEDSEHIRIMIDYGENDATERFVQSHPDVTTKPENKKAMKSTLLFRNSLMILNQPNLNWMQNLKLD